MEQKKKKSKTPLASEADYFGMIDDLGEITIEQQYVKLGAKKISFSAARRHFRKKKCFDLYMRKRTYSEAAASTGYPERTVYDWFEGFKITNPLN